LGDFQIKIDGAPVTVAELLPGFDGQARLGVVLRDDFAAVGASSLLLTAVTGFYDVQRTRNPDGFFRYPDYFLFHVGRRRGNHNMLEVFPDHKEVIVADNPEDLLRAINDRSVTHLLVPEGERREAAFHPMTVNAAMERLKGALLYSPTGRVERADVEIAGNERVDYYVWATLEPLAWADSLETDGKTDPQVIAWIRSLVDQAPEGVGPRVLRARESLKVDGRTVETFRRIGVDEALERLSPQAVKPLWS
jgi:hypothetical protein